MPAFPSGAENLPERIQAVRKASSVALGFETGPLETRRRAAKDPCDFVFGSPKEMPLPGFVDALQQASMPEGPEWFAYKYSEESPRRAVAESLRERLGTSFDPDDILLTNGAWGALAIIFQTLLSSGDEVVYVSPPWFYYEAMIVAASGTGVSVPCDQVSFDLDIDAIAAAISPRTRAVLVNSPNNPTGRIYPGSTLQRLADVLDAASAVNGRPIYLVSDEAYQRIVFPGTLFVSPTAHYPHSFLVYSYGKTLLAPGQRLGYIALPPGMPNAQDMRSALHLTQLTGGQGWPDAVMQYALPRLEKLCVDLERLRYRRDILVETLRAQGYSVHVPDGTFYLLPRSPIPDDLAFAEVLADHDVFVLPGSVVQMPGYFRLSLTADDEMVSRSVARFASAHREATRRHSGQRR